MIGPGEELEITQDQKDDAQTAQSIESEGGDALIGKTLAGNYLLLELIGTGGWGNVYRGQHLSLACEIAVKVLHKHLLSDPNSLKRLEQEARLLSLLESPYIVRVIDYGTSPSPFIVMEYFDGTPLNLWLRSNPLLSTNLAIEMFMQICDGLTAAHQLGLVHRDLKPGNLLLKLSDGILRVKILDFGIAKVLDEGFGHERMTATGQVLGSPPYMSPEQWTGRTDERSDIYSLGCIIYEVLSGKPAFSGQHGIDYLNEHLSSDPLPIHKVTPHAKVSPLLEAVLKKCLQKSAANRYQSAAELKKDLEGCRAGRKFRVQLPEQERKVRKLALLIMAVCLCFLGTLAWMEHEPVSRKLCSTLNAMGDKERIAGRRLPAVAKYRQSILFAQLLPQQDPLKLHALRMLSVLLKEGNDQAEANRIDKEVADIVGVPDAFLQKIFEQLKYERDVKANLSAAEALGRQALEMSSSKPHSLAYSRSLEELGSVLRLGLHSSQQALDYDRESYKIASELLEPDDLILAERLNQLGNSLWVMGSYDESRKVLEESLAISQKKNDLLEMSISYHNMSIDFFSKGQKDAALVCLKRALTLCPKDNEAQLLKILHRYGYVYLSLHDYENAVVYLKRALALRKKEGSSQDPDAEHQWSNLGLAYYHLKDYAQAEQCFETGLKLRMDSDRNHPRLASIFLSLIRLKQALGKDAEAQELAQRYQRVVGRTWRKSMNQPQVGE